MNSPSGSQLHSRQSLKRISRTTKTRTTTPTPASPSSRSQLLHIIEELSEEDNDNTSSRHQQPSPPQSPTRIAKSRRRQGLPQGAQVNLPPSPSVHQLSFGEQMLFASVPPRPAPRPPSETFSDGFESPDPFRLTFNDMGISFKFPHPPLPTPNTPNTSFSMSSDFSRNGASSPTPSLTSSQFSSPRSTSNMPLTPCSSDDESFYAQPKRKVFPPRASIKPLFIVKNTSDSLLHEIYPESEFQCPVKPSTQPKTPIIMVDDLVEDDVHSIYSQESDSEEATEWYAREMESVLSLYSPAPSPIFNSTLPPARPESFQLLPAPAGDRMSKPLPQVPAGPSQQLDPTFSKLSRRASLRRSSRPPPPPIPKRSPPPTPSSPDRPPPRMSLPADVDWDILGEDEAGYHYSPEEFTFSLDDDVVEEEDFALGLKLPEATDLDEDMRKELERRERELEEALGPLPTPRVKQEQDERVLRSRWSSSTLSSVRTAEPRSSTSSKLRLFLGGVGSPKKASRSRSPSKSNLPPIPSSPIPTLPPTPMSPFSFSLPAPFFSHNNSHSSPQTSPARRAHGLSMAQDTPIMHITHETVRALRRKDSRTSTHSRASSSGGSECSVESNSGLKRKPIPVEMFLRS